MIKKKKVARFRELYAAIDQLLQSYNYDDVSKILHDEYEFEITTKTLRNYVYRHRKKMKNDGLSSGVEDNEVAVEKSSVSSKEDTLLKKPETESKDFVSAPPSKENDTHVPPTLEELDAAMDGMKKRQELKKLGLL